MTQTPETTNEDSRIRPREILLFALFGLVPFGIVYLLAFQGMTQEEGRWMEEHRRALVADCMEQKVKRADCRHYVDTRMMVCYQQHIEPHFDDSTDVSQAHEATFEACIRATKDGSFTNPPPHEDDEAPAATP